MTADGDNPGLGAIRGTAGTTGGRGGAAHPRDAAGVGPHERPGMYLRSLKQMGGWRVAPGDPDVRGWPVRTVGGAEVGEVRDLLVDVGRGEVVLLDIAQTDVGRRVRAPLRGARVDRAARVVLVDGADLRDAATAGANGRE